MLLTDAPMMVPVEYVGVGAILTFGLNFIAIVVAVFKMGRAVEKFEAIGSRQALEITGLKDAVKVIADLVTKTALQSQSLDNMSERVSRAERLVDDLRRGEGWILPLNRGANEAPPRMG